MQFWIRLTLRHNHNVAEFWHHSSFLLKCVCVLLHFRQIITVELNRGWNSRLGFSLQNEPNTNQTYIRAIYPESVAAKDGRLRVGDQILMVSKVHYDGPESMHAATSSARTKYYVNGQRSVMIEEVARFCADVYIDCMSPNFNAIVNHRQICVCVNHFVGAKVNCDSVVAVVVFICSCDCVCSR